MTTKLIEGDLEISFPGAKNARNFDGQQHGLSHCMKAVDFVVEFPDRYLFVELKDPETPVALPDRSAKWIEDFRSGELDDDLVRKFRDSFIYEWAAGRADKPVFYYVLVAVSDQHSGLLGPKTADLRRRLPASLPPSRVWKKPIAHDCQVFNLQTWNMNLSNYPVRRLSSASDA